MKLRTELVTRPSQLSEACLQRWNELAKNPFQSWDWLGSWAEAYSTEYSIAILKVVSDCGRIWGFAPFCLENRLTCGQTLTFLGSGKACTDHLSLLTEEETTTAVCDAITDWLLNHRRSEFTWDHLELVGVDSGDLAVDRLVKSLRTQGVRVDVHEGLGCYAIDLPPTWDEYVKMRSKSGRREIRQALRSIDHETIEVELVTSEAELSRCWDFFTELHQRRRTDSGTDGCFDHPHFERFLRTAAERLLKRGNLRFLVAYAEGRPAAAHFAVADEDAWYFYQSGMEPELAELRPGLSLFCHAIRSSIDSNNRAFDMLRGDEAYKLRWRATLRSTQEVRAFNPRLKSQVRGSVVKVGAALRSLLASSPTWPSATSSPART